MKFSWPGANTAPKFWERDGLWPRLLSPLSFIYGSATAKKVGQAGYRAAAKVICVGNVTVGGSGKTPTALAIAQILLAKGKKVHFISKGYGRQGKISGAILVKGQKAEEVGDEPLLLSLTAPTWVGDDRCELAKAAEKAGAEIIIMDDGLQNADIEKDFSLIVIDGSYGLGNNRVLPAGPLREPLTAALKRAQSVIIIGKLEKSLPQMDLPVFKVKVELTVPETVKDEDAIAFCGIGRPEKFFSSLKTAGLNLKEELAFPDHHFYNEIDFKAIFGIANAKKAVIVTTAKDMVKIPERFRPMIYAIAMRIKFENEKKFSKLLIDKLK